MRLFVGNLPYQMVDAKELIDVFATNGVTLTEKPHVVTDRETGNGRGFAFVEVPDAQAEEIINVMRGALVGNRPLRVDRATPKPQSSAGSNRSFSKDARPAEPSNNWRDRDDRRERNERRSNKGDW